MPPLFLLQKKVRKNDMNRIPNNLLFDALSTEFKPENVIINNDIQIRPLSLEETKEFESKINECIDEIFVEGIHFGSVPGVKKRFIFKAGCEVILNLMGLVARTTIVDKVEDYANAVFSYTSKTYLIDSSGCVRAEGYGVCNSKENKFLKLNPYNVQNVLIKLSRKRSITDAVLSVASLSNKFSQDEDLVEPEQSVPDIASKHNNDLLQPGNNGLIKITDSRKPATSKQIAFLEKLMQIHNISQESISDFISQHYGLTDYHALNSRQISEIINKYKNIG